VANHVIFEADDRAVRARAAKILATPALLPTVHQAAYKTMLNDFITVANLRQPGPG
jgi:predicted thioesterase